MKTAILPLAIVPIGLLVAAWAGVTLNNRTHVPPNGKAYFNVQLNTGEYWACYARKDRNLVPLCIPRATKP